MSSWETARSSATALRVGINAQLLSTSPGYRRAGIHHYIARVLQNLVDHDGTVSYTVFTRDSSSVPSRRGLRVVSTRWPTERRVVRILWEQSAWPAYAARENFDLLHSMAFVTPIVGRTPSVVTVYDLSFVHYPDRFPPLQRFYLRSQTARSVRQAARVIAISEAGRRDLLEHFAVPEHKVDVVLPGIEAQFRPLPRREIERFLSLQNLHRPFILHVGTLQPRKNLLLLLEAFARMQHKDLDLVLVGARGWYYKQIFAAVESLGLIDRVRFPGYVADEDLPFWYNAADLLVFPSVYEGFGMPIVEAMACGTPVVAARSSSIPEAGGDAARYFEPHDADALGHLLGQVLDDSVLADSMRRKGIEQSQRFSWRRAGRETSRVYARAVTDR